MYVLDTNVLIAVMKNEPKVVQRIKDLPEDAEIFTTIINVAELYYGAYKSERSQHAYYPHYQEVHLCSLKEIEIYGKIKSELGKKGQIIADNDLFIASIAQGQNATLVTNNTKHFLRIKELTIEDWSV